MKIDKDQKEGYKMCCDYIFTILNDIFKYIYNYIYLLTLLCYIFTYKYISLSRKCKVIDNLTLI